ncbi:MAG: hypothetical protein U0228_20410 [Myxococcaceae bacterium]
MTKPAFWIWLLSGPVLTGVLITVLLLIPAAAPHLGAWIIGAAILSHLVAWPFSAMVGKAMMAA